MDPLSKEFLALLQTSGWTKAEAARRLEVTPSLISQYANGVTRPSPQMVRLFKLVLVSDRPAARNPAPAGNAPGDATELQLVAAQLREIYEHDPAAFRHVVAMVDGVYRGLSALALPPLTRVSRAALPGALAQAHPLRSEVSERKPKAASTSGSKSAPRPRASRRPSTPRAVPAPAPAARES